MEQYQIDAIGFLVAAAQECEEPTTRLRWRRAAEASTNKPILQQLWNIWTITNTGKIFPNKTEWRNVSSVVE